MKQTIKTVFALLCILCWFTGCGDPKDGSKEDPVVDPVTTETEYTVTIVDKAGKTIESKKIESSNTYLEIEEKDLAKKGYSFTLTGENDNKYSANYDGKFTVYVTSNLTLTVDYTPNTYTVSFQKDYDANGTLPEDITCTYDEEFTMPENTITNSEKKADGWRTFLADEQGNYTYYEAGKKYKNLTDENDVEVVLYANFKDKDYKITFEKSDTDSSSFYLDKDETIPSNKIPSPFKAGYDLDGWYDSSDTTETPVDFTTYKASKNVSFKPKFTAKSYTVTFVSEHGTTPSPVKISYASDNSNIVYLADCYDIYGSHRGEEKYKLIETGYTFDGWYDSEDKPILCLSSDTYSSFADKTLTAKWTTWTGKIVFTSYDAEGSMEDQTFTFGDSKNLSENQFKIQGKKFTGWATSRSSTDVVYLDKALITWNSTSLFDGDGKTLTLYPVFEKLPVTVDAEAPVPTSIDKLYLFYDESKFCIKVASTLADFTQEIINKMNLSWYVDGVKLPGEVAPTLSIYSIEPGTHTVTVVSDDFVGIGDGGGMASASLVVNVSAN